MKYIQVGILVGLLGVARCLEVGVPERFLRPRTFNPHPYTLSDESLVEERAPLDAQNVAALPHPYSFFERPPTRGEPSNGSPIQFPKVPESAQAQPQQQQKLKPPNVKHPLHINDVKYDDTSLQRVTIQRVPVQRLQFQDDQLQQVAVPVQHFRTTVAARRPSRYRSKTLTPKNYAFSYAVRDGYSGDDFSHSQAHSGAQTKGEYRVKLPDGRTQVVSYTADDHGYRADVRYDEENSVEPSYDYKPQPVLKYKAVYKPGVVKDDYKQVYLQYTAKPDYTPIHEEQSEAKPSGRTAAPQLFNGGSTPTPTFFLQSTPAPKFTADYYTVSSTPAADYYTVSSTPAPVYYRSSTVPPRYTPSSPAPQHNYYLIQ